MQDDDVSLHGRTSIPLMSRRLPICGPSTVIRTSPSTDSIAILRRS